MRVIQVFVQHEYVFIFQYQKTDAAELVRIASTTKSITISDMKFSVKAKRAGTIFVTLEGSSGKMICDLYGTIKVTQAQEGKNGKSTTRI